MYFIVYYASTCIYIHIYLMYINYVFSFTFLLLYMILLLFYFTWLYFSFHFLFIFYFLFLFYFLLYSPCLEKKKKYYKYSSERFQSVPGLAAVGTSTAHSPKETLPVTNGKCAARARVPPACDGALWAISLYFVCLSAFSMGASF